MTDHEPTATSSPDRSETDQIAFEWRGSGEPLLLIHGTGGSRFHWEPVIGRLAEARRLLLVDLPGHGSSPHPTGGVPHTPVGYAAVLGTALSELGIQTIDICGHSAGGWAALELAKHGRAKSVLAIAPAGLWARRDPWSHLIGLASQHMMGRAFAPLTPKLLRSPRMRAALMQRTFARPRQIEPDDAIALARLFAGTRGLLTHLNQTRKTRFHGGQDLAVPVTVAWGERERSIPASARLRGELPPGARYVNLENCGHMAVWDDPELLATLILRASSGLQDPEDISGVWESFV